MASRFESKSSRSDQNMSFSLVRFFFLTSNRSSTSFYSFTCTAPSAPVRVGNQTVALSVVMCAVNTQLFVNVKNPRYYVRSIRTDRVGVSDRFNFSGPRLEICLKTKIRSDEYNSNTSQTTKMS